jgi:hypothetical protein
MREEGTMDCTKCKGFMVREWCGELHVEDYIWRCVNCGHLVFPALKPQRDMIKMLMEKDAVGCR